MAKHTPGPWRVFWAKNRWDEEDALTFIGIGDANAEGVADCGFGVWRSGEEAAANARLIAAAPDLLEALEILECGLSQIIGGLDALVEQGLVAEGSYPNVIKGLAIARTAIAKAADGAGNE